MKKLFSVFVFAPWDKLKTKKLAGMDPKCNFLKIAVNLFCLISFEGYSQRNHGAKDHENIGFDNFANSYNSLSPLHTHIVQGV